MPHEEFRISRHYHPFNLSLESFPHFRVLLAQFCTGVQRFDLLERILKFQELIFVLPLLSATFDRSDSSFDRTHRARSIRSSVEESGDEGSVEIEIIRFRTSSLLVEEIFASFAEEVADLR